MDETTDAGRPPTTTAELDREFQMWLRNTAHRKRLTQDGVARLVQAQVACHPRSVSSWFQGGARPRYHQLVALCRALGELPPALQALCPDERADET